MEKRMFFYDIHCHLLPGMDDGCKTPGESLALLEESRKQGISGIVATPHYYPGESVDSFLQRRNRAHEMLLDAIKQRNRDKSSVQPEMETDVLPVCLGAEVAYHAGLVYEEQLPGLCLGKSKYLLLELPFQKWSPNVIRDVHSIRSVRGLKPVIAHLERYFKYQDPEMIDELRNCDVLVQMNAEYILGGFWDRRKAKKLLKYRMADVLGSDSHNMDERCPNLGPAADKLQEAGMDEILYELGRTSKRIFYAAQGEKES